MITNHDANILASWSVKKDRKNSTLLSRDKLYIAAGVYRWGKYR